MTNMHYEHSETPNGQSLTHFMINLILFFLVGVFDTLQELTADDVYKWLFRGLSTVSLCIIIYINYHKAKIYFKKNKP